MKVAIFTVLCTIVFFTFAAGKQATTLTLDKSVELALQKNVSVIQARNQFEGAQSATTAAVGGLMPTLDANMSFSRQQSWRPETGGVIFYNGIPISTPAGTSFNAINSYSGGLSSQITLFDGFANTSNVRRAQANASASEYSLGRAEQSTIFQTHTLFLNVVRTYQLLKSSQDNLKQSQQQLERISESNKVGAVAVADVYRQQVQVGTDELALIQAENNYEKAKADLIAFLGVETDQEYNFDISGVPTDIDTTEFKSVNDQYANLNNLVATATDRRPDYLSSVEALNSAESSVTMARAGHLPTISAQGSFGYNNTDFGELWNRNLYLSLNLSLPIFRGFSIQNQVEQAEVQRINAEEGKMQAERQLRVDIRKALLDLEAAEKQVNVSQTTVKSAQLDRTTAQEKYNLGAGTLLDLLVATANYTTAVSNKVNAVTSYLLAKKQLEYTLGTIAK